MATELNSAGTYAYSLTALLPQSLGVAYRLPSNMTKQRYWLFRRGGIYYLEDSVSGLKESLHTRDPKEAQRVRTARNEAAARPLLGLTLGRAYLAAYDPMLVKRTWRDLMDHFIQQSADGNRMRRERAMRSPSIAKLAGRSLIETTADDLRMVLADGRVSTNHFLRVIHNLGVGLGWLPWPILSAKLWPKLKTKAKRGISPAEYARIMQAEMNPERRQYYALLWEIGASQIDAASLTAENIDWSKRTLSYQRRKTGVWAHLQIGVHLEELLRKLPQSGPLFPSQFKLSSSERAAEFRRRCRLLKLEGISLHSFRYSWAERARSAGYPERWAQTALGHTSRAVHAAYAKGSYAVCPPLQDFENREAAAKS